MSLDRVCKASPANAKAAAVVTMAALSLSCTHTHVASERCGAESRDYSCGIWTTRRRSHSVDDADSCMSHTRASAQKRTCLLEHGKAVDVLTRAVTIMGGGRAVHERDCSETRAPAVASGQVSSAGVGHHGVSTRELLLVLLVRSHAKSPAAALMKAHRHNAQ